MSDALRDHARDLAEQTGLTVEVFDEGRQRLVLIRKFPIPCDGWSVTATDVLFIGDEQYPMSSFDMFWTEVDVTLANGAIPKRGQKVHQHLGREWRRFSWHPNAPDGFRPNPLLDHFSFMESRWQSLEAQ